MGELYDKLVSIIVPAFNVENYIEECLRTILKQSYSKIEVLVVDDGSTDGTWQCIERFMQSDSRVHGFHRQNAGVSASRNFAIDYASGEYICFIDSDDFISDDMISLLVKSIESDGSDWVNCQYHRVDDKGRLLEEYDFKQGLVKTDFPSKRLDLVLNSLLDYQIGYEVWNKLFKSSIIREHKISFIKDCHIGEDLAFNICYAFYANAISCIPERPYYYRVRSDSAMGVMIELDKNFREHLSITKGIQSYFENAFDHEMKDRFYQLFVKIMSHASHGHTANETVCVAKAVGDDYYIKWLTVALKHRPEFTQFFGKEQAKLNYRCGLYIKSKLGGDLLGDLYIKSYNIYCIMRKRSTIGEWKLW